MEEAPVALEEPQSRSPPTELQDESTDPANIVAQEGLASLQKERGANAERTEHNEKTDSASEQHAIGERAQNRVKKLLRRSAIVLGACLAVLGVLVVIELLIPEDVTREQAQRAAVDFTLRNTREGVDRNELTASCGRSGDAWLCGIRGSTTACTDREVGAVMVGSSGTAVGGNLSCKPPRGDEGVKGGPPPDPFSDERKVEASIQTLITGVHEQIVARDYHGAFNQYSKRKRAQLERRDGFDKWSRDQAPLSRYLDPSGADIELQDLDRKTEEATVRVTGMDWSKPGASCSSWSGLTWAKYEDGRWRYDPGYSTTPERKSRWEARYDELLGATC